MTFFRKNNHMFRRLGLAGKIGAALVLGAAISNEARGQCWTDCSTKSNRIIGLGLATGTNNGFDLRIQGGFADGTGEGGKLFLDGGDGGGGTNGNVLIGTQYPAKVGIGVLPSSFTKLLVGNGNIGQVEAGATFGGTAAGDKWSTLGGPAGIPSLAGNYGLRLNTGAQSGNFRMEEVGTRNDMVLQWSDNNASTTGGGSNDARFRIGFRGGASANNPFQEYMTFLSNGNVGIGTSSPSNRLTVNSGASIGSSFVNTTAPSNGLIVAGNTGIGTSTARNRLTVSGASSIGSGYVNTTAPSNGLIVQGQTGIGVTSTNEAQLYVKKAEFTEDLIAIVGEVEIQGFTGIGVKGTAINSAQFNKGVQGEASGNEGNNYGVEGSASGDGTNFGVYGVVNGTSTAGTNYAVFGEAGGTFGLGSNFYAGYFNGQVISTVAGNVTSDRKFKTGITTEKNLRSIINQLRPVTYKFNSNEEFSHMHFDRENIQHGFIAQELQEVLPELVSENVHPAEVDSNGNIIKGQIEYLGVNYIGLISILTKAIQEQDQRIEELEKILIGNGSEDKVIHKSEREPKKLFSLSQNKPNPYDAYTKVDIRAEGEYTTMEIWITSIDGVMIEKINAFEKQQLEIAKGNKKPGIYLYNLVVDGFIEDTKRMIIE